MSSTATTTKTESQAAAAPQKTSKQLKRELDSIRKQQQKIKDKGHRLRGVKRCTKCCNLMLTGHSLTCKGRCMADMLRKIELCPRKEPSAQAKGTAIDRVCR
jgi:hypothetical protein